MKNLKDVYAMLALAQIPRILSLEDRNEFSPTYGCFDRTYWLDKAIDFSSAIAQFSVHSLALAYSYNFPNNIFFHNEKIKKWCMAGMDYWTKIQKKDGSFDEFYPNEHGWAGPTGFLLYSILESYKLLKNHLSDEMKEKIYNSSIKAAKYLIKYDESGVLANHHAIAMAAIYTAYDLFKENFLLEGYNEKLKYFLKYVYDEGWSLEYDGADIGYQSATISFLGKIYKLSKDAEILSLMKKFVDFTSFFVYPNNYYAGTVGSRQTLHFYPHGYEIISDKYPFAGKIADQMLLGLKEGKLVPPEIMPDRYLPYRIPEFLLSYLDHKSRTGKKEVLPCESKPFKKYFSQAKIFVIKKPRYYSVVNLAKGGVVKVFSMKSKKLVYNDCGIIGTLNNNSVVSSQWIDKNYSFDVGDEIVKITGNLHKIPSELPTPSKMLLLRTALLTLGRNTGMAYWLKGKIRNMIILKSKPVPVRFEREIRFLDSNVEVQDVISLSKNKFFKSLKIGDEFSVRYVPQSLFFQKQELGVSGFNIDADILKSDKGKQKITAKRNVNLVKNRIEFNVV